MNQQIAVSAPVRLPVPAGVPDRQPGPGRQCCISAGSQIIDGTLTLGQWQEFSLYLIYLFFPVAQFGFIITQLGQASASAARIFEILDAKNDVTDKPGAITLPVVQGQVGFENVTFRYFGGGEPVLKNVSFYRSSPARPSPCWALPVLARPPSST